MRVAEAFGLRAVSAWPVMLLLLSLLWAGAAIAADPQPYKMDFAATGESELDAAIKGSSQLESLREKAPAPPFALVARAKGDIERLQTALQSYGYYRGTVAMTILGRSIDDADLPALLEKIPDGEEVEVGVAIDKGPQFRLRRIAIQGAVEPDAAAELRLAPGQPALAAEVLAARDRLQIALQERGHALAKVEAPDAVADLAAEALDLTFTAVPGPRLVLGDIALEGLQEVNEPFVRRHLLVQPGDLFQPSKIEAARLDLAQIGVFSGVAVRPAEQPDGQGRLPLTFDFAERPKRAIGVTAAYSTDLGGSLSATWSHRNLFGNAEQLNLSGAATGLGGTAVRSPGYNFTGQYLKPDYLRRDQSLDLTIGALKQDLEAYDQTAFTIGAALHRKLDRRWTLSLGLSAEQERITQERITRDYTLFGLPFSAKYDSTDLTDLLQDPTHGVRAAFTATPWQSLGGRSTTFAVLQISGSTYIDLGAPGRSVLALRGLVGSIQGASTPFDLPPDQRFYGGGSATVRGFKYQSIGPQFPSSRPTGGTGIAAATVEFRQRILDSYGVVGFLDAGQVSADNAPFTGTLRAGVGVGLRYYTPIGAIRADVAMPLNRPRGGDSFELYIGLGQAF